MKQHTTNYQNAFILVAVDCKVTSGTIPTNKSKIKTSAQIQFEMIGTNPYKYTSDEVLFEVFAYKKGLMIGQEANWVDFFSKGQPCLRVSPLAKNYGWGIHFNNEAKIAIYGLETKEYQELGNSQTLKIIKAMKSSK